jgi:hypothetical protein
MKKKFFTLTLAIVCIIALSAAFTACENGTKSTTETEKETPKPETPSVTTTLTIDSISFSSTPGANLDFTPSYSSVSNPTDFSTDVINSCLTYTITVVNHDGSYTNTWNSTTVGFDGKIFPRTEYGTDLATFTQTFYNKGTAKGSRTLKVMVDNNKFEYFGETYDITASVPAITGITITK